MRSLDVRPVAFPLVKPFAISRGAVSEVALVEVVIGEAGARGRGECRPYARYDETQESVVAAIEALRAEIEGGLDRAGLRRAMPAGAARNAVDAALIDLEAKRAGRSAWEMLGLPPPAPVEITYTIGLDTPDRMAAEAAQVGRPLLKLKLGGEGDLARVEAVRAAVPEARLIVDANEAWDVGMLDTWCPRMAELGVELIEQPLHADRDEAMRGRPRPVPLCADESCHDRHGLDRLEGLYDCVNVKLDKTGGLTEAIDLVNEAEARGFGIMLGCMMASSLAMAPAFLLAGRARFVDLDAPLLLAADRDPPVRYHGAIMQPPPTTLWG